MNTVNLIGRLTKDPELKYTATGIAICKFTLAVNRDFTNQNGEREADFIGCIAWRKQAETLAKFINKGALLGIEGRIQTGQYETENGIRYTTDVVCDTIQFLESKGENTNKKEIEQNQSDFDDFYATSKELSADEDLPG